MIREEEGKGHVFLDCDLGSRASQRVLLRQSELRGPQADIRHQPSCPSLKVIVPLPLMEISELSY